MPDRVKSFREIDSRENRPRDRPGFVKPIRNGLRKEQNLIECRPTRAETGLAGRENEITFQKEENTGLVWFVLPHRSIPKPQLFIV